MIYFNYNNFLYSGQQKSNVFNDNYLKSKNVIVDVKEFKASSFNLTSDSSSSTSSFSSSFFLFPSFTILFLFSDPPKILSVGPDRLTTAHLFTSATFECIAEGNPPPTYQWLQRLLTSSDVIRERGREAKLHISNVTYDFQGEYVCKVTNIIGGTERTVQSEAIALQVVGKQKLFSITV